MIKAKFILKVIVNIKQKSDENKVKYKLGYNWLI